MKDKLKIRHRIHTNIQHKYCTACKTLLYLCHCLVALYNEFGQTVIDQSESWKITSAYLPRPANLTNPINALSLALF